MTIIRSHRDLIVWQKAMKLVVLIHRLTDEFPQREVYALGKQMRNAAVSIPSNLAEGRRRSTRKDFAHFIAISFGSASELETQLELANALCYGNDDLHIEAAALLQEVLRMLNVLLTKIREPYNLKPTN